MQKRRSIATAAAVLALGAVLAGCTAAVEPAVSFAAEKLTISVPRMVVGQAVSETLPEAMGGKQELAYSLVPVIPGLTFNPATRVLSGTPTMPGMHNMTYTAKDTETGGTMESVRFDITVTARLLTPEERIRGTWRNTGEWWYDNEVIGTWVELVTFTKDRYIHHRLHVSYDGSMRDSWNNEGTWEITDREIVRIWYYNHDDEDDTPEILTRLPKEYAFLGDDLLIHHWASEEGPEDSFDRMTRFSSPSLSLPPLGVWTRHQEEDDGWFVTETMTLEAGGAFTWSEEYPDGTWTLTAEWEVDLDSYFINLTNATGTWTGTGEEPEPHDRGLRMVRYLRFAYAPAVGRMVLSSWRDELDDPHGDYWREMRQQQ